MSSSTAKKCPYPDCRAILEKDRIMCWPHWQLVPSVQQRPLQVAALRRQAQPHNDMHKRLFRGLLLKALQGVAEALEAKRERRVEKVSATSESRTHVRGRRVA